jgi:hypothetical protein
MTRKPLSDGSRYYANLVMPRKISAGRALAHNRVRHTLDMPNGRNGFSLLDVAARPSAAQLQTLQMRMVGLATLSAALRLAARRRAR